MKSPLSKLVPELQRSSSEACERIAGERLSSTIVRDLVSEAALLGLRGLRIKLPDGPTLHETKNAKQFEKWARDEGFHVEWLTRNGVTLDGRSVVVYEPEITW
jgi:hypothetical protein